jgi:hypothetical protein
VINGSGLGPIICLPAGNYSKAGKVKCLALQQSIDLPTSGASSSSSVEDSKLFQS